MQLQNVAHNTSWVRKFRYKISEMINVHILCSKCPPAATHARSIPHMTYIVLVGR